VTALTGRAAYDYIRQEEEVLGAVAAALKVPPQQAADRVAALLEEVKTLKKQATQRRETPKVSADDLIGQAQDIGGAKVVSLSIPGLQPDELRQLIDVARRKAETGLAALLITEADGKVVLAAGLTPDLVDRGLHAGNWLKQVAPVVGGGGGGKPDFAQAGGKKPDQIPQALEKALEVARETLGG
jgi:alanyl-tRNA synthetase